MATKKVGPSVKQYRAKDFGEEQLIKDYNKQLNDAKNYFLAFIKPRLDRAYKLYIAYTGDRAKEIKSWQSNVFIPYIQGVVETLMPRILDARPEFSVQGRTEEDQAKSKKIEFLNDYYWEKAQMDSRAELLTRSALIYGTGFAQAYWKKDVRKLKFLKSKDLANKELKWTEEERTFYDAPAADWIDNYSLWYDWRNVEARSKRFWFKRLILTKEQIKSRYPMHDPKKLEFLSGKATGKLEDYASIRREVKSFHSSIARFQGLVASSDDTGYYRKGIGFSEFDGEMDLFEVFEWWRPFDDQYAVMADNIPILKDGSIPIPYDFKEAPFIAVPYMKVPGEFEGYGLPAILENPQIMLNTMKNQRIDAVSLNIHKMWIVNPLANIDKSELVTRPFGIIYSTDPNGVREVQFSDVKASAYQEEKLLKDDMRFGSGVDDFSIGVGGGASSATEVRHLRESTIERVRLFINHLGDGFAKLQRYWIAMTRQFFTEKMIIRITGSDGQVEFPIIEKDDVTGEFDFKATVIPSIAGQNEVKKKQDLDLLQLLLNLPFIDQKKLVGKVLYDWNWEINQIALPDQGASAGLPTDGAPGQDLGQDGTDTLNQLLSPGAGNNEINPQVIESALRLLGGQSRPSAGAVGPSPFAEAARPLPQGRGIPPTAPGINPGAQTTNPRGLNRGLNAKVNTNIPLNTRSTPESELLNRSTNIQR